MRPGRTFVVFVAVAALVVAGVAIARGLGERFAHGSDRGEFPVASAAGRTHDPHAIFAKVTTRPRHLEIAGKFRTNCAKLTSSGTRGNRVHGRAPVRKKLRLRFSNPDVCDASVTAQMGGTGRIKVELFAKPQ